MIRISLVACVALVAGCKSKSSSERAATGDPSAKPADRTQATPATTPPPAGPVPALRWTDAEGELLLASGSGDQLEAACGLTGTITATEVSLGGVTQPWTVIQRTGRQFSLPKLDWVIDVGPTGDVVHTVAATPTPLGKVTGLEADDAVPWFGAFVIAAALVQHKLELVSLDGATTLALSGAADLKAWEVKAGGVRVVAKNRDDPRPVFGGKAAFDPGKLTVTRQPPGTYLVEISRDDDALRAAFPADRLTVVEDAQGGLGWRLADDQPAAPFARLTGRAACRAHDQAVGALVWAFLGTDAGAAQLAAKAATTKGPR